MKNIDQLIEAVFEGQDVHPNLSPTEAREVDSLRALKADLRQLRDVPECQLTVDHLRRAMLNQPVPKPRRNWIRLTAWVPVAAAAGLALVMMTRATQTFVPTTSESGLVEEVANASKPLPKGLSDAARTPTNASPVLTKQVVSSKKVETETVASKRVRRSIVRPVEPDTVALMSQAITDTAIEAVGGMGSRERNEAAPSAGAPQMDSSPSVGEEPVVIVGDTHDPETGAAEAREISRPSDVVFGG